jgi:uncharacterized protein YkwD
MKKSLLYSAAAVLSAIVFFTISVAAQKNRLVAKPVDKKTPSAKTVASQTSAVKPAISKTADAYVPSAIEQAVLEEINFARREPQKYIAYLEEYKKRYKGNTVYLPNSVMLETNEGVAPVDEAIEFLKKIAGLSPYAFSNGMNKAAGLHLKDLMIDSTIGHTSKDGSTLPTRLKKFGIHGNIYAENIAHRADNARDIVLRLIIDDGVKSRSHRNNIFSAQFKVVGIAFGKGKSGDGVCVINFADSFLEPNQKLTTAQEF